MIYDEIEYFNGKERLYKTCLPERSTAELRIAILNHGMKGGGKYPTRFVIYTNGKVRIDSDKTPILMNEMRITKCFAYVNKKTIPFWGRLFRDKNGDLCFEDIKSKKKYLADKTSIDLDFYNKNGQIPYGRI